MNDDELISRRKKQNADRVRAYRKRKKDLGAMPSTSTVQSVSKTLYNKIPKTLKPHERMGFLDIGPLAAVVGTCCPEIRIMRFERAHRVTKCYDL
ncbi:hypothetical protein EVAR_13223_1 [Eumeta japonica]|uniref:BZIP domain-containing protein n=1 Tax=Eumeta variegata TaxID=151549 RepID=A0A4C1TS57_EUMVA|nr:hypothetical protein EVAR_13223_1 [Eumeta japonica]